MTWPPHRGEPLAAEPADAGWACWRPAVDGIVELGALRRREVGLPTRFRAEGQMSRS